MKSISHAALFAFLMILFVVITVPHDLMSQRSMPPAAANGKRIFNQSCSACHDTLGATTKSGPELKNYYRHQPRPSDVATRNVIQNGKGKMPAFSTLNKSQIDDLVAYLKTL